MSLESTNHREGMPRILCLSSEQLSPILERAGVAVTPGIDFGANAEGYLRFSYANSLEKIAAALDRLGTYLRARQESPRV